jgi:hypothetical protein
LSGPPAVPGRCEQTSRSVGAGFAGQMVMMGAVRDADGAALAGVHVDVASPALVEKFRSTITNADGRFRFVNLPVGPYSVILIRAGFWMWRRDDVVLTRDAATTIDATLRIGGIHID